MALLGLLLLLSGVSHSQGKSACRTRVQPCMALQFAWEGCKWPVHAAARLSRSRVALYCSVLRGEQAEGTAWLGGATTDLAQAVKSTDARPCYCLAHYAEANEGWDAGLFDPQYAAPPPPPHRRKALQTNPSGRPTRPCSICTPSTVGTVPAYSPGPTPAPAAGPGE
jgi:hypothetical protein